MSDFISLKSVGLFFGSVVLAFVVHRYYQKLMKTDKPTNNLKKEYRVLIIGPGLVGLSLYKEFHKSKVVLRRTSNMSDANSIVKHDKERIRNTLLSRNDAFICDTVADYEKVILEYQPTHIIDTSPQPSLDHVNYLLSVNNCFKIFISSPASDFAKSCPDKCPIGSYPRDKLEIEKLVTSRAGHFKDALVIQIGFIPEIITFDHCVKPVFSGLSFDTMVLCKLLTNTELLGEFISDGLENVLSKFDKNKGFTCTSTEAIGRFIRDIVTESIVIPDRIFGRVLAMHSAKVWPRSEIIKVMSTLDNSYRNELPEYYGQKSMDLISKPVKEFQNAFDKKYWVTDLDIVEAIKKTNKLFHRYKFSEQFCNDALRYVSINAKL
jgi:hypothetical protein